jgi:hypothetical protein
MIMTYLERSIGLGLVVLCLNSCATQHKANDCKKYFQTTVEMAKVGAVDLQEDLAMGKKMSKTKRQANLFLHMANGLKKDAAALEAMKTKDLRFKQLLKDVIKSTEKVSQGFQDQANAVGSLPEDADSATIKAKQNINEPQRVLYQQQLMDHAGALHNYCSQYMPSGK